MVENELVGPNIISQAGPHVAPKLANRIAVCKYSVGGFMFSTIM